MTASYSEALRASMCAAPSGMEAMPGMSMESGDYESPASSDHSVACDGMSHGDESSERCPLTPAATQGCLAAASLPAAAISIGMSTPLGARHTAFDNVEPQLLLSDALYHPPRA